MHEHGCIILLVGGLIGFENENSCNLGRSVGFVRMDVGSLLFLVYHNQHSLLLEVTGLCKFQQFGLV